ncbi:hypothetical protein SKAU_G00227980 [Synaphobranchus kaupii]|uniref:Uncharacterized protein n=1 Tax=Synaphobranchus kaupii TaxID=118154 RepID=A0A9Q1F513_SYNKA|nr:hypothetical protein SKAU_G00227980 [Synaphobranchus kaupii]
MKTGSRCQEQREPELRNAAAASSSGAAWVALLTGAHIRHGARSHSMSNRRLKSRLCHSGGSGHGVLKRISMALQLQMSTPTAITSSLWGSRTEPNSTGPEPDTLEHVREHLAGLIRLARTALGEGRSPSLLFR